jgi:hypothetical protein
MIRITREEDRVTLEMKQKDDDEVPLIALQVEKVDLLRQASSSRGCGLGAGLEVEVTLPRSPHRASPALRPGSPRRAEQAVGNRRRRPREAPH